jgi:S-adenosylmethionine:tRNA ribosyltransferase-isomerase
VHIDPTLTVDAFDFHLPERLIAQEPLARRDASRLFVLARDGVSPFLHRSIRDLPSMLRPGDLLVGNNSRVLPARLWATKPDTGALIEILLLRNRGDGIWEALAKPARKLKEGLVLSVQPRWDGAAPATVEVVGRGEHGQVLVRFEAGAEDRLGDFGVMPLPPYIHRPLEDPDRYQTVYAKTPGSAAAPTAGLHLTPDLLDDCFTAGAGWAEVTLHIGLDTFRPVTVDHVADHKIHTEWCSVPDETAALVDATRERGGRVFAIGTTAARTLETYGRRRAQGFGGGFSGPTDIFITPGYQWTVVDGLLTNFHLPKSTLIIMISSLAGRERVLAAYEEAIRNEYRFFSFGDAMLIV